MFKVRKYIGIQRMSSYIFHFSRQDEEGLHSTDPPVRMNTVYEHTYLCVLYQDLFYSQNTTLPASKLLKLLAY